MIAIQKRKKIVQCTYNRLLCVSKCISVKKELHLRHTEAPFPLCTMLEVLWLEDFSADSLLDLYISRLVSPYRICRFPRLWIVSMLMFYRPVLRDRLECQYNGGRSIFGSISYAMKESSDNGIQRWLQITEMYNTKPNKCAPNLISSYLEHKDPWPLQLIKIVWLWTHS